MLGHGIGSGFGPRVLDGIPRGGLKLFLTFGPDGERNPKKTWKHRSQNLLRNSGDLTGWDVSGTPVVTAKTIQDNDGAQYELVYQIVRAPPDRTYTWTLWVPEDAVVAATRFPNFYVLVGDTYRTRLDTSSGATTETPALGASHTVTSDTVDGVQCWKVAIVFTTDDAGGIYLAIYPAAGANADLATHSAAAVGTITVIQQQLTPGTEPGEYEETGDLQQVFNWALTDRRNLLESSGDLTGTGWAETGSGSIDDATHFTFAAQNDVFYQNVTTVAGISYTFSFNARAVTGNTDLFLFHYFSATGNTTAQAVTATLTRYSVTVLGKTGGGVINFGIQDNNASGFGQVELTDLQVEATATATHYQLKDASNVGWLDAQVGSAAGSDTNDPGDALWRKNLLADGSTEDLENAAWSAGDATVDSATLMTFDAQNGSEYQWVPTVDGVSYTLSFQARRISGNTSLRLYHGASETGTWTPFTITDTPVRYSVTILGKSGGGNVAFGVLDSNASNHGQIEVTEWQVEVGPLTDYNADDRQITSARGSFTTDDYLQVARTTSMEPAGAVSLVALFRSSDAGVIQTLIGKDRDTGTSYRLRINSDKLELVLSGPSDTTITGDTSITDDQWHLGVGVYDGAFIRVYLDGVSDKTPEASTGSINYTADDLYIGYQGDGAAFMEGTIALVAVYDLALTPALVRQFHREVKRAWSLSRQGHKNLVFP